MVDCVGCVCLSSSIVTYVLVTQLRALEFNSLQLPFSIIYFTTFLCPHRQEKGYTYSNCIATKTIKLVLMSPAAPVIVFFLLTLPLNMDITLFLHVADLLLMRQPCGS